MVKIFYKDLIKVSARYFLLSGIMTILAIIYNFILIDKIKIDLFNFLYENGDYESVYHFLMTNFGQEKIDSMIKLLGKPFIDWSIENSKNIDKLFECNYVIADYTNKLETNTDPIVLGMTIIGKFRNILKEN